MGQINDGEWDDNIEETLGKAIAEAIDDFGPDFDAEGNELEEGESDRVRSEEERQAPGRTSSDNGDSSEGDSSDDETQEAEANPVGGV